MTNQLFLQSRLNSIDWDFVYRRSDRSSFSRVHWYPGQLISQIPSALIGLLSAPNDLVVDPFAGSGSVITEAQRLGRRAVAIDINPISNMIVRAKTLKLGIDEIRGLLQEIAEEVSSLTWADLPISQLDGGTLEFPPGVQVQKWYSTKVAASLSRFWQYCNAQTAEKKSVCDVLFSSCLRSACRETRSWGYICDNVVPQDSTHEKKFDLFETVSKTLRQLGEGYEARFAHALASRSESNGEVVYPDVTVVQGTALEALRGIGSGEAKLVVTSPPYYGIHDYVKAQRLSMEWFDLDISSARQMETGARSKRSRRKAREEYLTELLAVFEQCHRVLVPHGSLCVVVGESTSRSSVLDEICDRVRQLGFTEQFRSAREIGNDRPQAPVLKTEDVIVWQK